MDIQTLLYETLEELEVDNISNAIINVAAILDSNADYADIQSELEDALDALEDGEGAEAAKIIRAIIKSQ